MATTYGADAVFLFIGFMVVSIFLTYFCLNFFTGKFLGVWLKARMGGGKFLIVHVTSLTGSYVRFGKILDNQLYYKPRNGKEEKMLIISDNDSIYRKHGVFNIDVDEKKNAILKRDYSSVSGYDAETVGNLIKRALYTFNKGDKKQALIFLLLLAILAASVIALFIAIGNQNNIEILLEQGVSTVGATI